jgi:hypothetical protein
MRENWHAAKWVASLLIVRTRSLAQGRTLLSQRRAVFKTFSREVNKSLKNSLILASFTAGSGISAKPHLRGSERQPLCKMGSYAHMSKDGPRRFYQSCAQGYRDREGDLPKT